MVGSTSAAHMLPAAVGGPRAGQLDIGFFRTVNGATNPNDNAGKWTYATAESTNATSGNASFIYRDVIQGFVYHDGQICNAGVLCGAPGEPSDRSLLDFTSAALDTHGCPLFTFAGNPGGGLEQRPLELRHPPADRLFQHDACQEADHEEEDEAQAPQAGEAAPVPPAGARALVHRLNREERSSRRADLGETELLPARAGTSSVSTICAPRVERSSRLTGWRPPAGGKPATIATAMTALAIVFWISVGLLAYAHVGYGLLLAGLARLRRRPAVAPSPADDALPSVSVIVAAYAEEAAVIAERIANLRTLDYPPERLELIVACDGSPDAAAGAGPGRGRRPRARAPAGREDPGSGRGRRALPEGR